MLFGILEYEQLINLWFFLWALIWVIYLVFDMFTNGVNLLLPFVGKGFEEKKMLRQSYGPFWGGIEVWLILAVGATFAVFPHAFGEIFSSLYLMTWLFVILIAVRGVFIEYMFKFESNAGKIGAIWAVFLSTLLLLYYFGIFMTDLFYGIAYADGSVVFYGDNLTNMGRFLGLFFVGISMSVAAGCLHIRLKNQTIINKARKFSLTAAALSSVFLIGWLLAWVNADTMPLADWSSLMYLLLLLPVVFLIVTIILIFKKQLTLSYIFGSLTMMTTLVVGFTAMYPNVLTSTIDAASSITIYEGAASQFTLTLMLIATLITLPVVIGYIIWSFIKFGQKVDKKDVIDY